MARPPLPDIVVQATKRPSGSSIRVVEVNLDGSDQIDQALHPGERCGTPPEDSGVGPARFSARGRIGGIFVTERPPLAERDSR